MQRPREIEVEGLVNIRDLGGLERQDGSVTPCGVFFRSENLDGITGKGWEQLRALGVATVVDLRQERERQRDVSARPNWVTTRAVDLDGWENQTFWKDYWDNGLVGTALYYTAHMTEMPDRAGAVLSAIVSAPPGGVLFHCMGGRDRTGMVAMLLLTAVDTKPDEIVDDYLETVRRGEVRAARAGRPNDEPALEAFCRDHGTTTEQAFRDVLAALELDDLLQRSGISAADRVALRTWRGTVAPDSTGRWLPADFSYPVLVGLRCGAHLRPIRADDVTIDFPAVMGSRRRLWEKYGTAWGWPPEHMTLEQDRDDLARHEREIAARESFNYAVLDAEETELLGCVYIDPPEHDDTDALISWWVIDNMVDSDLDNELAEFVPRWVTTVWPFHSPRFTP